LHEAFKAETSESRLPKASPAVGILVA